MKLSQNYVYFLCRQYHWNAGVLGTQTESAQGEIGCDGRSAFTKDGESSTASFTIAWVAPATCLEAPVTVGVNVAARSLDGYHQATV